MILEDHQKHQPAEGGKVSERWVGKLSKRCVQRAILISIKMLHLKPESDWFNWIKYLCILLLLSKSKKLFNFRLVCIRKATMRLWIKSFTDR